MHTNKGVGGVACCALTSKLLRPSSGPLLQGSSIHRACFLHAPCRYRLLCRYRSPLEKGGQLHQDLGPKEESALGCSAAKQSGRAWCLRASLNQATNPASCSCAGFWFRGDPCPYAIWILGYEHAGRKIKAKTTQRQNVYASVHEHSIKLLDRH